MARATEELSLCVDTVLARTEMGEPLQGWEVETLVDCFNGLLSCWVSAAPALAQPVPDWPVFAKRCHAVRELPECAGPESSRVASNAAHRADPEEILNFKNNSIM